MSVGLGNMRLLFALPRAVSMEGYKNEPNWSELRRDFEVKKYRRDFHYEEDKNGGVDWRRM